MRKLTAMALSMMFILGSIIPVGAEETQTRQSTISVSIAYKIMDGNKEFSTATYAESGNSTNLTLSIDKSEWDKAYAGSYSDTLVFTISYR